MTAPAEITARPKRKRAVVSYAVEDYYDELALGDQSETDGIDESDDDAGLGSRKSKGKAKRVKITKESESAKAKEEKPFRFFDLPPELRDEIYQHALLDPEGISLVAQTKRFRRSVTRGSFTTESTSYYRGKRRRHRYWRNSAGDSQTNAGGHQQANELVPNILAVNKQIRKEASAILYHQDIILEDTSALHTFIAQIGPYNRDLLRNITITGWGQGRGVHKGHNFAALSILATCINLEKVFMDCSIGWYRNPVQLARQIFRDGHYFLEAIGATRGKYDAALEVLELSDWHFDKNRDDYHSRKNGKQPEVDPKKREAFNEEVRKLLSRR